MNKDIVLLVVQSCGLDIQYAKGKALNNINIIKTAINNNPMALQYAPIFARKDKVFILQAATLNDEACKFSLLEGYQTFDEIVEKEGEGFLFSCYKNDSIIIKLQVATHSNFIPTLDQLKYGLSLGFYDQPVRDIYQLRKDESLAKIEENKLKCLI